VRFKVDENLPVDVAVLLRTQGYDAETVGEEGLGGKSDAELAEIALKEQHSILTLDRGLGNIRAFPPAGRPGTIILRPDSQDVPTVLQLVRSIMPLP
jgi:Uncharacterized conserved protein